jgi:hypothetical protein
MEIDRHFIARLARECAMNIKNREEIREIFQLTEEDFQRIEQLDYYKRAYDHMVIEWNGALSTPERLRLNSAALLEEVLLTVGARATNPTEPLGGVVESAKFLARTAGLGEDKQLSAPTDRFVIQINMGNGETVTYDKPIIEATAATPEITQS